MTGFKSKRAAALDEDGMYLVHHTTTGEEHMKVNVTSVQGNLDYCKCPRCWHFTHEGLLNFDGLCDRCCRTLVDSYPNHKSAPHIIDNWNKQKENA